MVTFGAAGGRWECGPGPSDARPSGSGLAHARLVNAGQLLDREHHRSIVASGFRLLDGLLPAGGVRRGSLLEWLAGEDVGEAASGAVTLACAIACRLADRGDGARADGVGGSTIVVVDRLGWFHPPAMLPWLAGQQLVVARPSRDEDEIWAIDQALHCPGVAAVLAWPRMTAAWSNRAAGPGIRSPRTGSQQQWTTAMRRWQLAARSCGAVGLIVRPAAARSEPSWAEARIAVAPLPSATLLERRLRLVRVGGVWSGRDPCAERPVEVVLDLMRGCEPLPQPTELGPQLVRPERPSGRGIVSAEVPPTRGEGGVSCRAS